MPIECISLSLFQDKEKSNSSKQPIKMYCYARTQPWLSFYVYKTLMPIEVVPLSLFIQLLPSHLLLSAILSRIAPFEDY